jgi:transposase-like protein
MMAIEDYEKNGLSLDEVLLKYNVSEGALSVWRKRYSAGDVEALKPGHRGRPPMGRPKKKEPQTELEKLQTENERFRAENALLKKVRALVEEREARLRETWRKPSKS